MKISINNQELNIESVEDFGLFLDQIDSFKHAEVWINSENGSSICLLKSIEFTFLMYLESPNQTSLVSHSKSNAQGNVDFLLANGQMDFYPLIWCIDKDYAYKGLAYFFVNSGEKSPYIAWVEE